MFMKTFEEKFTAWLDGELSFDEAQAFEKEHPSIHEERAGLLKLKLLLKQGLESHVLEHPDFFNSQIMDQIRATRGRSLPRHIRIPRPTLPWSHRRPGRPWCDRKSAGAKRLAPALRC